MKRNKKGFALGEMLVVLGITAIISSISLVGVSVMSTNSKMKRADSAAKAVFTAAQSVLLEYTDNGKWEKYREAGDFPGSRMREEPSDFGYWLSFEDDESVSEDYVFSEKDGTMYTCRADELINLRGVLDDELISGAGCFIEYNARTAVVYSVIYIYEEEDVEYEEIFALLQERGRMSETVGSGEAREYRKNLSVKGRKVCVGYYGGGLGKCFDEIKLLPPAVRIVNGEKLTVYIKDENSAAPDRRLYLRIEGKSSGAETGFYIDKEEGLMIGDEKVFTVDYDELTGETVIVLDSIVPLPDCENRHFLNIAGNGFCPGEDIVLTASLRSTEFVTRDAYASEEVCSLFENNQNGKVTISAIRHLENLDYCIGGFKAEAPFEVELTCDLDFASSYPQELIISSFMDENGSSIRAKGGFYPVSNIYLRAFNGNNHVISDFYIFGEDLRYAGLFGELGDCEITGIGLVSKNHSEMPFIKTDEDTESVGAFVGTAENLTITECFSVMTIESCAENTGGFAGRVKRDAKIICSYGGGRIDEESLFYLKDKANISATAGGDLEKCCVGGFVGRTGSGRELTIERSFSTQSIGIMVDGQADACELCLGGFAGKVPGIALTDEYSYYAAPVLCMAGADITVKIGGLFGNVPDMAGEAASSYVEYFAAWSGKSPEEMIKAGMATDIEGLKNAARENIAGATLPFCPLLDDTDYPFPEITGIGTYYGDWQDTYEKVVITVKNGIGIKTAHCSFESRYGETIDLNGCGFESAEGYENTGFFILNGGGTLYEGGIYKTGTADALIECRAGGLLPPIINTAGGGNYVSGYKDAVISVCNLRKYEPGLGIRIVYRFYRTCGDESEKEFLREVAVSVNDASDAACTCSVDKNAFLGTKEYCVMACAYDGCFYSDEVSSESIEITISRVRVVFDAGAVGRAPLDARLTGAAYAFVAYGDSKLYAAETGEEEAVFGAERSNHLFTGWLDENGNKLTDASGAFDKSVKTAYYEKGVFKPVTAEDIRLVAGWRFLRQMITLDAGFGGFY